MVYQHQTPDGQLFDWPLGKVVCVGRNYADHAKELNNPVPAVPLLFIKPASAVVPMTAPFRVPRDLGQVHFETEMAILIGQTLTDAEEEAAVAAIAGIGLGLDLTLRDLQDALKKSGHPWEKAKSFDGACPLSPFISPDGIDLTDCEIRLTVNGELRQQGNSAQMLTPVLALLSYISKFFTLNPGDVVLTGTPAGVGPVRPEDRLVVELAEHLRIETSAC
ncbi:MAG: fumarylacetoacetate hydrolase family protein [Marinobacterium sp.]|nr:fumarylacetoacetate hydrolase family protein [Marinobacterium sp.]